MAGGGRDVFRGMASDPNQASKLFASEQHFGSALGE
jgi:hypothetical protein